MPLTKHFLAIALLSLLTLFIGHSLYSGLEYIVAIHKWFSSELTLIFTSGDIATYLRELLALLALPLLVGLVPAGIYWGMKKRVMPHLLTVIWVMWIIQTTAVIVLANQGIF